MRTETRFSPARQSEASEIGLLKHFRAKRGAVGALAIGAQAVGALALGALAVGALAVGRLVIGRWAVGKAHICSLSLDELDVKRLRVGGVDVTDRLATPAQEPAEPVAR